VTLDPHEICYKKKSVIWGLSIARDKSVFRTPFSKVLRGYIDVYRATKLCRVESVNKNIVRSCNKMKIGMRFKSMQRAVFKPQYKLIILVIM
jgi:hypothetical protein